MAERVDGAPYKIESPANKKDELGTGRLDGREIEANARIASLLHTCCAIE